MPLTNVKVPVISKDLVRLIKTQSPNPLKGSEQNELLVWIKEVTAALVQVKEDAVVS